MRYAQFYTTAAQPAVWLLAVMIRQPANAGLSLLIYKTLCATRNFSLLPTADYRLPTGFHTIHSNVL